MTKRTALAILASLALVATSAPARADEPPIGPPVRPAAPATTRVFVRSRVNVELLRFAPEQAKWIHECTSPCGKELPIDADYQFREIAPHTGWKSFRIDAKGAEAVELRYAPASTGLQAGGALLITLGVLSIVGGVALFAATSGNHAGSQSNDSTWGGEGLADFARVLGAIALLNGVGLGAGGAALVATSGPSSLQKPLQRREQEPTAPVLPPRASAPVSVTPIRIAF